MQHFRAQRAVYAVTSVIRERAPLFEDSAACRFFLVCLEFQKRVFSFKLFGFVIMPEHIHLILQPSAKASISKTMQHLKGNYARKFNHSVGRAGSIWQPRFYDVVMRDERQLLVELDYIHYNPVRAGLVSSPEDWEFSSYNSYYGLGYRGLVDRLWQ